MPDGPVLLPVIELFLESIQKLRFGNLSDYLAVLHKKTFMQASRDTEIRFLGFSVI